MVYVLIVKLMITTKSISQKNNIFQKWSALLSSLCLIHCLTTPFIIILLPSVSQFFSHWVETALILAIFPISSIAFFPIWTNHKNKTRLFEFLGGLFLILIAQIVVWVLPHESQPVYHVVEILLMILGTGLVAWASYKNRKHTHTCKNPNHVH